MQNTPKAARSRTTNMFLVRSRKLDSARLEERKGCNTILRVLPEQRLLYIYLARSPQIKFLPRDGRHQLWNRHRLSDDRSIYVLCTF